MNDPDSGRRARRIRELFGETQKDFAQRLGISAHRWSNFERGYPISVDVAKLLYTKLCISMDYTWFGRCRGLTGRQMLDLGIIQGDKFNGTI